VGVLSDEKKATLEALLRCETWRLILSLREIEAFQKISFSPIFRKAFPLSLMTGPIVSSGAFSVVFRFTVSPQTPLGNSRRFAHIA